MIGVKSIKNYSVDVINGTGNENPSIATLDTFARYVMDAPHTDEARRKENASHFPYWSKYKKEFSTPSQVKPASKKPLATIILTVVISVVIIGGVLLSLRSCEP